MHHFSKACYFFLLLGIVTGCAVSIDQKPDRVIGFKIVELYRPGLNYYNDSISHPGRPVLVRLWYPAVQLDSSDLMRYSEYIQSVTLENRVSSMRKDHSNNESNELYARHIRSFSVLDSANVVTSITNLSQIKTISYSQALPYDSLFPLVIVSGANPVYHIDLIEELASRGFVVASIPRLGVREGERLPFDHRGAKIFSDDLLFMVSELKKYQFVNNNNISFVAWSYEGVPSLVAAEALGNINCLISLDASIGYQYGNGLVSDSIAFSEKTFSFPLVHFTGPGFLHGKSFDLLKRLNSHSDVTVIEVPEMSHASFTSLLSVTIPAYFSKTPVNTNYETVIESCISIIGSNNKHAAIKEVFTRDTIYTNVNLKDD